MSRTIVCPAALTERVERIVVGFGAEPDVARDVAAVLVEADRRGVVTHGVTRLATYIERIRRGQLDPNARPSVVSDGGGVVLLDAGRGFGAVAGIHAARLAAERARTHGAAWITTRNSNHFGIAGYYTAMLAREGLLSMVCSNAGASMAATGGRTPVVGTNPISFAVPDGDEPPVLDMAVTHVARGKIRRAQAEGRPIPEGWAMDAQGRPTTDPDVAMQGMLAPMAGHKGYALASMIELMCGVLSDCAVSTEVMGATDLRGPARVSFSLLAVDIGRITDPHAYAGRVEDLRRRVAATAHPGERTHLPGGPETLRSQAATRDGIAIPDDVARTLDALEEEALRRR